MNDKRSMTYNEVKRYLAKTTGGHHTKQYSDTNVAQVKQEIHSKQR
ncbi:hypothetical protein [Pontibacillus litoralis]|uniref:Gamma-type small acid-soluble spore protein n=1 Tax=Pontibacillus litoralis JSM 072002 TaxID=1385512 RepID=A0A0A5G596_9BACI|nr:hypothetical protein [Pontibacillus litoralis]KGX87224.1 hypothetical protein N784_16460 [Pontibacillus litoralis JSM 072002]